MRREVMTLKGLDAEGWKGSMLWLIVYLGVILEWCGGVSSPSPQDRIVFTIRTNFTKSWGWNLVTIHDV